MNAPTIFALAIALSLVGSGYSEAATPNELDPPDSSFRPHSQSEQQTAGVSGSVWFLDLSRAAFDSKMISQSGLGRELVDVEIAWDGSEERFTALWFNTGATVHTLIQEPYSAWSDFFNLMATKNGRYLDVEVAYYGGDKKYSSIFLEDGDDYGAHLRTTQSDSQFQDNLKQYLIDGYSLIDFEAYQDGSGNLKYAGVWVRDPNQPATHLLYGLQSPDITDLVNPMAGRVIDIERYWDPDRSGFRYAMIIAQYPGGGWAVSRGMTSSGLTTKHGQVSDGDTHLIDLDFYETGGNLRYNAVWGDAVKSMHEVAAMPSEPDPEPLSANLTALINNFEGGAGAPLGTLGVYGRNLRTDQSASYRHAEPFYIASTIKTAIHVKLKREEQAGRLNLSTVTPYTLGSDRRDNWYVDERDTRPGPLNDFPGFGNTNWGDWFTLGRFDQAMMQVSDNAATTLLVDHPLWGVAYDTQDVNEWISSIPGVSQEFGLIVSIHDVDRTILWQGQQGTGFEAEESFFLTPGWAFERYYRTNQDSWGDLAPFFPSGIPAYDKTRGHQRLYASGIGSATPRAYGNLLEKLWEEDLLNTTRTREALNVMLEGTPFNGHPSFPNNVNLFSKGGTKGRTTVPSTLAVSNAGIVEMGPDAVSLALFTRDGTRQPSCPNGTNTGNNDDIRCDHYPGLAWQMLQDLGANLEAAEGPGVGFSPSTVSAGESIVATCDVDNLGGGDATGFDVTFYASTDQTIVVLDDYRISSVRIDGLPGYSTVTASLNLGSFPASIPIGDYWVGCFVDSDPSDDSVFKEVGEWDESDASNISVVTAYQLIVAPSSTLIFADGFESGDMTIWTSTSP